MMIIKNLPQTNPKISFLKFSISEYLQISQEFIHISVNYILYPKFLIRFDDPDIPHHFFNFQKFIEIQKILNFRFIKFRIYPIKKIIFWCEFQGLFELEEK